MSTVQGITPAMTAEALARAILGASTPMTTTVALTTTKPPTTTTKALTTTKPPTTTTKAPTTTVALTTTKAPTTTVAQAPISPSAPLGLSNGSDPSNYFEYPTLEKGRIANDMKNNYYFGGVGFGAPPQAKASAPGAGNKRYTYNIATTSYAVGAPSLTPGPSTTTGPLIGWPVVITRGAIGAGKIFKTKIDSFTTANDTTWGDKAGKVIRYGCFTFSPEPPVPIDSNPYKFFFARAMTGGSRRCRSRSGRKGRKSSKSKKGTRRH